MKEQQKEYKGKPVVTLKDLEIGDIFFNIREEWVEYTVRGNPQFNPGYGSSTRVCQYKGRLENKAGKISVVKKGEAPNKQELIANPINKIQR